MRKANLLKGEKQFVFYTIDGNGYEGRHVIECFNIKQAREQAAYFVANSRDSGIRKIGQIKLLK